MARKKERELIIASQDINAALHILDGAAVIFERYEQSSMAERIRSARRVLFPPSEE